jgi:hypothetical protein
MKLFQQSSTENNKSHIVNSIQEIILDGFLAHRCDRVEWVQHCDQKDVVLLHLWPETRREKHTVS